MRVTPAEQLTCFQASRLAAEGLVGVAMQENRAAIVEVPASSCAHSITDLQMHAACPSAKYNAIHTTAK